MIHTAVSLGLERQGYKELSNSCVRGYKRCQTHVYEATSAFKLMCARRPPWHPPLLVSRSGPGILGFGFTGSGQKTTLTAAARSGALAVSYYFRKSFVVSGVPDGSSIVGYLNYLVDDGAVVYVNGVEVSNLP